jgi:rhodanese-related sulfurtransferase
VGLFDKFAPGGDANPDEISFEDLQAGLEAKAYVLVDVREPNEFDAGHAPEALSLPLSAFNPADLPTDKPVVLICRAGSRSLTALAKARAAGFADARHYRGGMIGWAQSGGEVV